MDNFPEELRSVVNEHWAKYPPVHQLVSQSFGIFFLLLTIGCMLSSFLIIYVFMTTSELRIPVSIDINRLRRYRALEFRQSVTQGKHSAMRSLYNAMRKCLSLVLRR